MRLFIAINFNKETKDYIQKVSQQLKECSQSGNFTKYNNLHLTLVFIGEVTEDKVFLIKTAMNKTIIKEFELAFGGVDCFNRSGGDIFFVGVKMNEQLKNLNHFLFNELIKSGFIIEKKEYLPHLTLARQVKLKSKIDIDNEEISTLVNKISLMKSERINGQLIYSEIYSIFLK